ncbi:MAG: 16S rRNA (cytosine(967)-C(5))-methyltransferase RsmB [Verrucomicrobiae bacterium]|nr:16S rRNA (cytosine(967)-C(5))-methyltransferase RsmB [Verrucomicrobiae bacterium]
MVSQKPREIAARILLRHAESGAFLEALVDRQLAEVRLPAVDRALVQELCYGTLRWRATLDWLIERKSVRQRPTVPAQILLRLGLYQLFWLDRIPPHAAVNETVEAVRTLDLGPQTGFVNALLRTYAREIDPTRAELAQLKERDPALGWSHPRWLVNRWRSHLPQDQLQTFLAWNNAPAPTYARVNTLRADPAQVIEAWRNENVDYDFARFDWTPPNLVFRLRQHPPLERLKSLQDGWYYIQDPATLLSVHLLNPKPGEAVLDLCAAPGGKTTYLAQCLDNDGRIVAAEHDARRRSRLAQNCERLGADVTTTAPEDPKAHGPFDAVLLDAPCTNSGVLRRRLDARWRLNAAELERARRLQAQLLTTGLRRLRPGGRLAYSTCSVEPEENLLLVESVLAAQPGFRLESSRLLHPARDAVDGAFVALIHRNPSP